MWTCSELKKRAWTKLSANYWWALLLVFLYMVIVSTASSIISGIFGVFSSFFSTMISTFTLTLGSNPTLSEVMALMMPVIVGTTVISLLSSICTFALVIFLANPLICGMISWFFKQREQSKMNSVDSLFSFFRKESYKHIVSGMAWRLLWSSLWAYVSIIPILIPTALSIIFGVNAEEYIAGISRNFGLSDSASWTAVIITLISLFLIALLISTMINLNRYYSYLFTPYILIDDRDIGYREALQKSRQMSHGQKGRMFILDLSFIGWWMLVFLTCGFTAIALYPYLYATYTELYFTRKEEYIADSTTQEIDQATVFVQAPDINNPE